MALLTVPRRNLGFLGDSSVKDEERIVFITLFFISLSCLLKSLHFGFYRKHYNEAKVIKFFFPFSIFLMTFDNVVMALGDSIRKEDSLAKCIFICHPFIVPGLLMITFEITYLVHKRRSVNFCGIQFDEGRRIKTTIKSWLLRNFVGIVAGCLAAIGVCVNFDLVQVRHIDPDAGNTSWLDLFDNPRTADTSLHRFLGFLPTAILTFANIYFASVMWKFGADSSMVVHSSYLNPWIWQFIGTIGLAAGHFPREYFKVTSNSGEVFLVVTVIFLMHEVDKDMNATDVFIDFLDAIEDKTKSADENRQIANIQRGTKNNSSEDLNKKRFLGFGNDDEERPTGGARGNNSALVVDNISGERELVELNSVKVQL